jgi:hypothetical protein
VSPRLFGQLPPISGGIAKHPLSFCFFGFLGPLVALDGMGLILVGSTHRPI